MAEVVTEQQKRFFDLFGYLVLPGLLADVIGAVTSEFEAVYSSERERDDPTQRAGKPLTVVPSIIDKSERLGGLLDDARIDGIVAALLGENYNYLSSLGQLMTGETLWHPDGAGTERVRTLRMAFYLDAVGSDSGALRVIPGSHKVGDAFGDAAVQAVAGSPRGKIQSEPEDLDELAEMWAAHIVKREEKREVRPDGFVRALGLPGADIPAAVLASEPGDVVVFDQNILHSAWGGSERRRLLSLQFSEHASEAGVPELRKHIAAHARYWQERMYEPALLASAGEQRMRHMAQVIANEDMLPGLVQRLEERVPASVQTPWRRKTLTS